MRSNISINGNLNTTRSGTISGDINTYPVARLSGNISMGSADSRVKDYEKLTNKPSIESVVLIGNKNFPDFGLTAIDIDDLLEILV